MKLTGTIEVSNIENVVMNHKAHWKRQVLSGNTIMWINITTSPCTIISHAEMVKRIHGCMADSSLHVWLSGNYINIVKRNAKC